MKKFAAVIGYGGMGSWHVQHLQNSDTWQLAGVYDIDPARMELAKSRGIPTYRTEQELLEDPQVEEVTIAIPNDQHLPVVLRCLKAHKHVICEKPVALSVSDLEQMIACAKENGVLFTVHQNRRFDVDFLAMKQLCQGGEIGAPIRIESRIHGSRGIPSDWRGLRQYGGGMLYDWGVHLIDQILCLFPQKLTEVNCLFDHITNKEVDDGFRLQLCFEGGVEAFVEVGTYNFLPMPRFYLLCEKGTARLEDWQQKTKVALCTHWHESEVLPVQTAAGLTKTMAPRDSVTLRCYEVERLHSDVHDFYRNFADAIDGKCEQMVTHAQMLRVLRVIEAAFRSEEEHQRIKVSL